MRKTIAYARKMRSQPRQAKSPPHRAAGSTESKVNTTTATPTPEALAIAVIFKDFEIDHTPDGWPAIKQMHLSAAAAELERQHAEIEALRAQLNAKFTGLQISVDVSTGDNDAGHRLFGTVTGTLDTDPLTLLCDDAKPNFQPRQPLSVDRIKELSVGMAFESVAFDRAIEADHGIGEKT